MDIKSRLGIRLNSRAWHALSRIVHQYRATFPWYGALVAERDTVDFADLPVVDETMLTKHYYTAPHAHLPDAAAYLTSGTVNGQRKKILYSPNDEDAYVAQRKALFRNFLGPTVPGAVAAADLGTGHAAASARRIFEDLNYRARSIDFTAPITEHVEKLNQWQPDVFFTMPMILDRLMQSPASLTIRPRKIMVVGDLAPASWRRHVAQHFNIDFADILDVFGSIEIGAIAYYCAGTALYHFHNHIIPEVVPPGSEETTYTKSGLLLLTSLTRQYFPALRYATNDMITGLRMIDWRGQRVFAFDHIDGRFGGEMKHGERISNHDLAAAVTEVFPGAPFEVANNRQLEIRVVYDGITSGQVAAVRRLLMASSPDVAQMIKSGLVENITVKSIRAEDLESSHAKRLFNVGKG